MSWDALDTKKKWMPLDAQNSGGKGQCPMISLNILIYLKRNSFKFNSIIHLTFFHQFDDVPG